MMRIDAIRKDIKRLMQEDYETVKDYVQDKLPKLAIEILRAYSHYPFPNRFKLNRLFCTYKALTTLEIASIVKSYADVREIRKMHYKLRSRILQLADSRRCKIDAKTRMLFELLVTTRTIWNDLLQEVYNEPFWYNNTLGPLINISEISRPKLNKILPKQFRRTVNIAASHTDIRKLLWRSYNASWIAHLYILITDTFEFREPDKKEVDVNSQLTALEDGRNLLEATLYYRPQCKRVTRLNSAIIFLLLFWNFYMAFSFLSAALRKDFDFCDRNFYPIRAKMRIYI